VLSVEVSATS